MELSIFLDQLYRYPRFAIYGAQVVAYGAYVALRSLYGLTPDCFIVSNAEGNPAEIDGVAVITLDNCEFERENVLILVAVTELLQDEICATLGKRGYRSVLRMGAHEEHLLMSAYYESIGKFSLLGDSAKQRDCDLTVYTIKHHRDKQLKHMPALSVWEEEIQAGAVAADVKLACITDNEGYGISHKNPQYAEMTAVYWVWRNTSHSWKGVCHYRRRLVISKTQLVELADGGADAVLPLPYICYPSALTQFRRHVGEAVKDTLLSSLQTLQRDRYDSYLSIINDRYTYVYNLLAARRDVFDEYCEWVFPILEHMEQSADSVSEINSTRALAYSAELLTSLFFLANANRLNIKHIEKRIYT